MVVKYEKESLLFIRTIRIMQNKRTVIVFLLSLLTVTLSAQEAKYEFKSAIIKVTGVFMGQTSENVIYIDDFGRKESTEITMKIGYEEKHIRTIMDGNSTISIDLDKGTATTVNLPDKPINYLQLTPKIKEKYKITELGKEDVIGKICTKYSLEMPQMGMTLQMTVWIWEGLTLKAEIGSNGMILTTVTATEIQENTTIPEDKFKVPENIAN
ncbi:hypothetical protein FACS189474_3830 [Bacteroidia bacterium]|nr:hypothetical protein FACS189474_3830 [Bacteroidia bacterium]